MSVVDVKDIQAQAKKEIAEETSKIAVSKLKKLYRERESALLIVKNLDREIEAYLSDVVNQTTYEAAGVDTGKRD